MSTLFGSSQKGRISYLCGFKLQHVVFHIRDELTLCRQDVENVLFRHVFKTVLVCFAVATTIKSAFLMPRAGFLVSLICNR